MTRSRYIVGIDLGTTNCAVAYVDTKGRERPAADIRMFEVPQLVAPGETAPRTDAALVPLPRRAPTSCPPARRGCPGATAADRIVGEFARIQGARFPAAWSAAPRAGSAIPASTARPTSCPGARPPEIRKVSPVEASAGLPAAHPRRLERPRSPRTIRPGGWSSRRSC